MSPFEITIIALGTVILALVLVGSVSAAIALFYVRGLYWAEYQRRRDQDAQKSYGRR